LQKLQNVTTRLVYKCNIRTVLHNTYGHAPHNDISVNKGGPVTLYYSTYHYVTIAYNIQYSNMLYM